MDLDEMRRGRVVEGAASRLLSGSATFGNSGPGHSLLTQNHNTANYLSMRRENTNTELMLSHKDEGPRAPKFTHVQRERLLPMLDLRQIIQQQQEQQKMFDATRNASAVIDSSTGTISQGATTFLRKSKMALLPPSVWRADRDTQQVVSLIASSLHGNPLEEWESERMMQAIQERVHQQQQQQQQPQQQKFQQQLHTQSSPTNAANNKNDRNKHIKGSRTQRDDRSPEVFERLAHKPIGFKGSVTWRTEVGAKEAAIKNELQEVWNDIRDTRMQLRKAFESRLQDKLEQLAGSHHTPHPPDVVSRHVLRVRRGSFSPEAKMETFVRKQHKRQQRDALVKEKQQQLAAKKEVRDALLLDKDKYRMELRQKADYVMLLKQRQALWITCITTYLAARTMFGFVRRVAATKQRRHRRVEACKIIQRTYRRWKKISYTQETAAFSFLRSIAFVSRFRRAMELSKKKGNDAANLILKFLRDNNNITGQFRKVAHTTRVRIVKTQTLIRIFLRQARHAYEHLTSHWEMIQKQDFQRSRLGAAAERKAAAALVGRRGSVSSGLVVDGHGNVITPPHWLADIVWAQTSLKRPLKPVLMDSDREPDRAIKNRRFLLHSPRMNGPMPWASSTLSHPVTPMAGTALAMLEQLRREIFYELVFRMRLTYSQEVATTKRVWSKYLKMMAGLMSFSNKQEESRTDMLSRLFKLYPKPQIHHSFSYAVSDAQMLQMIRWAHQFVKDEGYGGKDAVGNES